MKRSTNVKKNIAVNSVASQKRKPLSDGKISGQGQRKDSATSLDMFLESEWSAFASDYEMHLLEVQQIPDSDLDSYNDDLKMIFGFVKYADRKEQLMNFLEKNETALTCVSGTAVDAIAELTHSSELKKVKEARGNVKGGIAYNMCQAIREMIEDGREEGRKEGKEEGRKEGRKEEQKTQSVNTRGRSLQNGRTGNFGTSFTG